MGIADYYQCYHSPWAEHSSCEETGPDGEVSILNHVKRQNLLGIWRSREIPPASEVQWESVALSQDLEREVDGAVVLS